MESHFKYDTATDMENSIPICKCQNQDKNHDLYCESQSRVTFDDDSTDWENCVDSTASLNVAKHKKATLYIEMDKHVNASRSGKMSDFKLVVKPESTAESIENKVKTCTFNNVCKKVAYVVIFSIYIVILNMMSDKYILPYFSRHSQEAIPVKEPIYSPVASKLQDERQEGKLGEDKDFHWASYYQDSDRFYKGIKYLPWQVAEDSGTGIALTDKDCFFIPKRSVYEIYSKITFEYTRQNTTNSPVYHNVQRLRSGVDPAVLDKNILSMPYRPPNAGRIFQTSSLVIIGDFLEGDCICIFVGNTSLVLSAKHDSNVKIIQKGH